MPPPALFDRQPLAAGAVRHRADLGAAEALRRLRDDAAFAETLSASLLAIDSPALRWECPVIRGDEGNGRDDAPFEFVTHPAPALEAAPPDRQSFARHFQLEVPGGDAAVRTVPNLGGDSRLVIPTTRATEARWHHLTAFLRTAPAPLRRQFWVEVGAAVQRWQAASAAPVWLSTAGTGVAWLHVRLDPRPKYYLHAAYRGDATAEPESPTGR